jgi:hypothetical protein
MAEPSTPRPRPTPVLTGLQRRALGALNDLGADLDDTLASSDLRHAFRKLARQYHPDRHPDGSDAEKMRLSRVFAELTDHYRLLAAALDTKATRQ